eukprot:Phypoly_transcript_09804.p1 GENE.Phypoly_transcript_09804~~Phypoly_transcript_09804.p1  ORF type:complete len:162 (-),score=14.16 Phypoly_transcript_09804:203-688(-)
MAAQVFPNVSFVQNGGSPKPPNLSSLSYNGPDMYYIAGIFCGKMTTNNKVGFIHPNAPEASFATLNAFYVGVKTANPDAEVFVKFTGSYLNPDRCAGASLDLLENVRISQHSQGGAVVTRTVFFFFAIAFFFSLSFPLSFRFLLSLTCCLGRSNHVGRTAR